MQIKCQIFVYMYISILIYILYGVYTNITDVYGENITQHIIPITHLYVYIIKSVDFLALFVKIKHKH